MKLIDKLANLTGWRFAVVYLLIGLTGVLGHAPFHIWPYFILLFALVFHLVLLAETPKRSFRAVLFIGLGYFLGQIYWIGEAFIARGPEFIPAMPPMVFALAFVMALIWAFAVWIVKRFNLLGPQPYLTLAFVFFVAEFIRGHLFGGFPWNLPGYIFKGGGAMSQSASMFGVYGLSLLVFVAAALLARCLWAKKRLSLAIAAAFLAGNAVFGFLRLSGAELTFVDNVRLRIVHVPVNQKDKMDYENPEKAVEIIREHLRVTMEPGLEDITHVIWPEGASDGVAIEDMPLRRAMGDILLSADDTPPYWLMNSLREEDNPESPYGADYFNTSAVLDFSQSFDGQIIAFNDKKKLVPFGEFVPGGQFVEKLGAVVISSSIASITPAPEKTLSNFPGLPLGSPQICYEVLFSGFTPKGIDGKRPQWILNQTNDAWFGEGLGPRHHANMAKYRAIEEMIPVIRSATNGFSGVIDPYGRYTKIASPQSKMALDASLPQPIGESRPLRMINLLIFLISLFFVLINFRRR